MSNFEATTDGKKIFTPKQWLERFRQYTKQKYKMDIAELIRGKEMTQTDWATKKSQIQDDFVWGIGPEALYRMTRAETKTETDKMAIKDLIRLFNEYFLSKRNTYNHGEWTKQTEAETPEDFCRRRIEMEKQSNFERITAEELLNSVNRVKFMTAIRDKKLPDKLMKEKKPQMKKTIDMIKQNTCEKKINKNSIPEALISNRKEKSKTNQYKDRTNSKHDRERNSTKTDIVDSVMHQTGAQLTNAQHSIRHAMTAGKRTSHGHVDKEKSMKINSGT